MASVRKSLMFSFAGKYGATAIQLISTIIIARLLTPEEIGVYSVGVLVVGFAHMVRDFGVSNYLVQEKELTVTRIRTAFGVTLLISWSMAFSLLLAADPLSRFYNEPGVAEVIYILSLSFFLIPISSTVLGLLRREMNFTPLFWIGLVSAGVDGIVAVGLVYMGYGYISLAWATVACAFITVVMSIYVKPKDSQFVPAFSEFKRIFAFGSRSSIAAGAVEIGYSAPELVIARVMNFEAVGLFSRALGLSTLLTKLFTSSIQTVAIPYFARESRETGDISTPYLRAVDYILAIAWPAYVFIGIFSFEIVRLLFGHQWDDSVPLVQILCVAFAVRLVPSVSSWALTSVGAVQANMNGRLIWEISTVLLVIPAAMIDLESICYALIIGNCFGFVVLNSYLKSVVPIRLSTLLKILVRNMLFAGILFVLMYLLQKVLSYYFINSFVILLLAGSVFVGVWLAYLYFIDHPLKKELALLVENTRLFTQSKRR